MSLYQQLRTNDFGENHGFVYWDCTDKSLQRRKENIAEKLKMIAFSQKVDLMQYRVLFANFDGVRGKYDSVRIVSHDYQSYAINLFDTDSRAQLWTVRANRFHDETQIELVELIIDGTWKDVKHWFNGGG